MSPPPPEFRDPDPGFTEFLTPFVSEHKRALFERILAERTRAVTVVLEDLHKAHNASACLRSCDCFGVQDVHVIEGRNRFRPDGEVAMGASRWLTLHHWREAEEDNTAACLRDLRRRGFRIVATTPRGETRSLFDFDVDRPTALVVGTELAGLTDRALELADDRLRIPMYGFTESFNVSVAVALCLQHFAHQLRQSSLDWRLSEAEQTALRAQWIRTVIGGDLPAYERRYREGR